MRGTVFNLSLWSAVLAGCVLHTPSGAPAQATSTGAEQAAPCPPNAALAYWRGWNGRTPRVFEPEFLEEAMRRMDANWAPPADIASQLEAAQPDIEAVMAAAAMEWCDWGVPLQEQGFQAIMPHLTKMRATARVLLADSRRLTAKGEIEGAARRAAAALLMTRHVRTDKTVYSVRTAQAIAVDTAMAEMRRLGELKVLDGTSRAILVAAIEKMSGPDPCGMIPALQEEPIVIRDSVRRLCVGPDAGKIFIEKFAPNSKPEERAQSGIAQLDEQAIHAAADRMAVAYMEAIANWESSDAVQQLRSIHDQKKAGDYGAVAALTGSELPHMRVIVARFENILKETLRVVNGETPTLPTPGLRPLPGK